MLRLPDTPERALDELATSLPVLVPAQAEELLLGLGLRLDQANAFPAGSTLRTIGRYVTGPNTFGRPGSSVLGTMFDLEQFAVLLGWPLPEIVSTTFRTELRRLFGPDVASRRLGQQTGFRVCPECVAESLLIRRETILPWVEMCSVHRIALVRTCRCGSALHPTSPAQEPFHCVHCWASWSTLARTRLQRSEDLLQRRLLHAYRVLLERGDESVPRRLVRLVAQMEGPSRWDEGWSSLPSALEAMTTGPGGLRSLASYVVALVVRDIPPELVFDARPPKRTDGIFCTNAACDFFGIPGSLRSNGDRPNGHETYCADCGSRYIAGRMVLTFDLDHGGALPLGDVAAARARLEAFHERLARACDDLDPRDDVPIGEVFRAACVPNARFLRARRLGLVQLIQSRLGRGIKPDPDSFALDPSDRWDHGYAVRRQTRLRPGPRRRNR